MPRCHWSARRLPHAATKQPPAAPPPPQTPQTRSQTAPPRASSAAAASPIPPTAASKAPCQTAATNPPAAAREIEGNPLNVARPMFIMPHLSRRAYPSCRSCPLRARPWHFAPAHRPAPAAIASFRRRSSSGSISSSPSSDSSSRSRELPKKRCIMWRISERPASRSSTHGL